MPDNEAEGFNRRLFLRGMVAAGAVPLIPAVSAVTAAPARAAAAFPLVASGVAADLYVDSADDVAVTRAVGDLRADVERVSGLRPAVRDTTTGLTRSAVLIGTIGRSPVIDRLIAAGKLDTAAVTGRWEASVTQVVQAPFAGVDRALVIAGSDRRGTVYGVYDLSERIGVSPWYWWADVPVQPRETVTVEAVTVKRREPAIRYRGIFINDEDNLAVWSNRMQETDKRIGPVTYRRIFELMLRLKANYLWPAMHPEADHFNRYADNARLADEYGIVVGSSHPEALLRNGVHEWTPWAQAHPNADGSLPVYDYTVNPRTISDYWRTRARSHARYDNVWTLGMRGVHDSAFATANAGTTAEKVAVMNSIIAEQRRIISEEVNSDVADVPQIFIPYKEVLGLYKAGVRVPDDVTLIWPDDNHGHLRQLPTVAEQRRTGGNGLYYHISYWGKPKSYLWLDTTSLMKIWQELRRGYDHQVRRTWIINVGDLKSQEVGTAFTMALAWEIDRWGPDEVNAFLVEWLGRQFGQTHAAEIADIRQRYYHLAAIRRPEFIESNALSTVDNGDEADARLTAYRDLLTRVQALSHQLPAQYRDAFFELLEYPVHGAYLMNLKFYWADRNALAVRQGRGAGVNRYADLAERAQADEDALTRRYNTVIAGGKWNGIINAYPAKVPKAPKVTGLTRRTVTSTVGLGVASEGNETGVTRPLSFSSYTRGRRFIDVFNTGFNAQAWTATANAPWVVLSATSGTNSDQIRLWVSVDWATAPAGSSAPRVTITGAGRAIAVPLEVVNDGDAGRRDARGFVEAHGYVSIEAEHFDAQVTRGGAAWQRIAHLGRHGDAVLSTPSTAVPITGDVRTRAPELQYNVRFARAGTYPVTVYRLPSLNELGSRRLAIGVDSGAATVLTGANEVADTAAWSRNVVEGVEKLTATITVATAGEHVVKLWMVDPAIGVDQIVIDTGGLRTSYLAPPESFHPVFNPNPAARPVESR
ncbi:MAG TPA: glycosyl hydrolase 115 family protein [Catenuloplanes sp.]